MPDTGNYGDQSLRGFLQMVEAEFPEELLRISEPVDTRFDMTAIVFELERAGKSPVIIFQNPTANRMPVVTNVESAYPGLRLRSIRATSDVKRYLGIKSAPGVRTAPRCFLS